MSTILEFCQNLVDKSFSNLINKRKDNQDLITLVYDLVFHIKTKHIDT